MVKPDWGALQKQFLTEHVKSNVSPKAWCEANGLNYATARCYIKLPVKVKRKLRRRKSAECAK